MVGARPSITVYQQQEQISQRYVQALQALFPGPASCLTSLKMLSNFSHLKFQLRGYLNNSLCPWQSAGIARKERKRQERDRAESEGTSFAEVGEILAGGPIFHLVLHFLLRPLRGISRASCSALGSWIAVEKKNRLHHSLGGLGKDLSDQSLRYPVGCVLGSAERDPT